MRISLHSDLNWIRSVEEHAWMQVDHNVHIATLNAEPGKHLMKKKFAVLFASSNLDEIFK